METHHKSPRKQVVYGGNVCAVSFVRLHLAFNGSQFQSQSRTPLHVHFELLCCTAADGRQWSGALKGISGGTGSICALESSIERIAHAPRDRKRDFIGAAHYVKCWQ